MKRSLRNSKTPSSMGAKTRNLAPPKTWNNVESEIVFKVLGYLYSPTNPKDMASRRLVCRHWRNVIDEHFEYHLAVDDTKVDAKNISHIRTKTCTILSLVNEVDLQRSMFRNPEDLSSLYIWGPITPTNFRLLLTQAVNLKQLSLTQNSLGTSLLLDNFPEAELQESWGRLPSLEIITAFRSCEDSTPCIDNLCKLLSTNMPGLTKLKLRFESPMPLDWERVSVCLFLFLERNLNLKTLNFHYNSRSGSTPHRQPLFYFRGDNQLESLILSIHVEEALLWVPVIQAQRSLKSLKISFPGSFCDAHSSLLEQLEQVVHAALGRCQDTLISVELMKLKFSTNFDVSVFRNMEKLTRFVIRPCCGNAPHQKFINLCLLPSSLEIISLGRVKVKADDLRLVISRLENIKELELINTTIESDSVMKEIYAILAKKENVRKVRVVEPFTENFVRLPLQDSDEDDDEFERRFWRRRRRM